MIDIKPKEVLNFEKNAIQQFHVDDECKTK